MRQMRLLLLLLLSSLCLCVNYETFYNRMNEHHCLDKLSVECSDNVECWTALNIRNTCLLQNNCNFTNDDEYNWPCYHCWIGTETRSEQYKSFVQCVENFSCWKGHTTIFVWLLLVFTALLL